MNEREEGGAARAPFCRLWLVATSPSSLLRNSTNSRDTPAYSLRSILASMGRQCSRKKEWNWCVGAVPWPSQKRHIS